MAVGARVPQAAPVGAGSVAGSRWHRPPYAERGVTCLLPALARLGAAVSVAVIGVEVPFHAARRPAQDQLAHARLEGLEVGRAGYAGSYEAGEFGFDGGAELPCARFFLRRSCGRLRRAQAGIGDLLADRGEFGGQAAVALEGVDALVGQGAGGALHVDVTHEHLVRAVAVLVMATACARAALHEAMDEGTAAHVPESGECGEDDVASLPEGRDVGGSWRDWGIRHVDSLLPHYRLKQGSGKTPRMNAVGSPNLQNPGHFTVMSYTQHGPLTGSAETPCA